MLLSIIRCYGDCSDVTLNVFDMGRWLIFDIRWQGLPVTSMLRVMSPSNIEYKILYSILNGDKTHNFEVTGVPAI